MRKDMREEFLVEFKLGMAKVRSNARLRPFQDECSDQLKNYINVGRIKKATSLDEVTIQSFSDGELYLIAKTAKELIPAYFRYDIEKYFTDDDKKDAYANVSNGSNKTLISMKAIKKQDGTHNEWIGVMSYNDIAELISSDMVRYNMSTQRLPKVFIKDGQSIFLADINMKSVEEIKQAILDETFISNTITLNILSSGEDEFVNQSKDENILIIDTEKYNVDVIDGMHRILGISKAVIERNKQISQGLADTELHGTMTVSVKNLTEDEAKNFIYQESLANAQTNETKSLYNPNSNIRKLIYNLNTSGGSLKQNKLYGRFISGQNEQVDDTKISISVLIGLIDRFGLMNKFDEMTEKTIDLIKFSNSVIEYMNAIIESTDEKSSAFATGSIVKVIDHITKSKDFGIDINFVEEYVNKTESIEDKNEFVFNYPMNTKNDVTKFKKMYLS